MEEMNKSPSPESTAPAAAEVSPRGCLLAAVFFMAYLAWVALYLIELRPMLLQAIMRAMGLSSMSFPAMLHLIPLIGLPAFLVVVVAKLAGWKSATHAPAQKDEGAGTMERGD